MAVGEEGNGRNPLPGSWLDQMTASGGAFWRRLLVWTAATSVAFAVYRIVLPLRSHIPGSGILCLISAFCCCAALGMAIYCFAGFTISRKFSHLLESTAFLALSAGSAIQAIVDIDARGIAFDDRMASAGILTAAIAFFGASLTKTVWRPETRVGRCVQFGFAALLVMAFPILAMPYAFDSLMFSASDLSPGEVPAAYSFGSAASLVVLVLVLGALVGCYRRYRDAGERMAGITCYFYIPWAFAILARGLSASRFDSWWLCSQAMVLHAWIVSLGAASIDSAMSHKEGRDRLDELEALHEISWTLVGATGVNELVNILADTLRERLQASIAAVYIADESRETLEVVAVSGPQTCTGSLGARYAVTSANRFPGFHSGHTARAFLTGEVQVARDVFVDVEFVPWRVAAVDDGCAVSLPLVDKGEAWGVLNLYFAHHSQLTPQRTRLLVTIAAAASPAIRSAQKTASSDEAAPDELDLAA